MYYIIRNPPFALPRLGNLCQGIQYIRIIILYRFCRIFDSLIDIKRERFVPISIIQGFKIRQYDRQMLICRICQIPRRFFHALPVIKKNLIAPLTIISIKTECIIISSGYGIQHRLLQITQLIPSELRFYIIT